MTPTRTAYFISVLAAALGLVGCDARPTEPTADPGRPQAPPEAVPPRPGADPLHTGAPRPQPPRPDLAKLSFDAGSRKLTVYDLPDSQARWMVTLPTAPMGIPVDREYQFPQGLELDLDQVSVFYTVPNSRPSQAVSLREIVDTPRKVH